MMATQAEQRIVTALRHGAPVSKVRDYFVGKEHISSTAFEEIVKRMRPPKPRIPPGTPGGKGTIGGGDAPPKKKMTTELIPAGRPGSEMHVLTNELGIKRKPGCSCGKIASAMDVLGVAACRAARQEIADLMKDNLQEYTLSEKILGGIKAALKGYTGLVSMVDEAIRRAEDKVRTGFKPPSTNPPQPPGGQMTQEGAKP